MATELEATNRDRRVRDSLLDALTVSSGAVDAISFLVLGKVFTAFMTGNIAFFGLRVAGASDSPGLVAILGAMAAFAVGVYLATRIVKLAEEKHAWPRRVTHALAASLIPHAAFQVVWFVQNGQPSSAAAHVLVVLWGIAMGMQSAAVRRLRVEGVFTTAATATIIYLAGDIADLRTTVAERRRLTGVLLSLFIGATAGGMLLVHAHVYAPVLPFVITAGVVVAAALLFRAHDVAGERAPDKTGAGSAGAGSAGAGSAGAG